MDYGKVVEEVKIEVAEEAKKRLTMGRATAESVSAIMHPISTASAQILANVNPVVRQGIEAAKGIAMRGLDYTISKQNSLTENYISSNEINNIKAVYGTFTGYTSAIASGAYAGSIAGPIGAGVGAVIGAVSHLGNEIINRNERMSAHYQALNATNAQTAWGAARAGLYDNGRGTEN